jgi:ABC-type proline/glycine betaine transport system ATPase subunit
LLFRGAPFGKVTLGDRLYEVISFRSVTASGSGGLLVDGLSFDAPKNSITAVLATPLVSRRAIARLANGIDRPAEGSVHIDGVDIATVNMTSRRRSMGWVAGPVQLFPHRTVAQQVTTAARLAGTGRRRLKLEAQAALVGEQLTHVANAYPHELSSAERVRAAFARAYCHNPEVMVLLDPFEGIDPVERLQLRRRLLDAQRSTPRTVLIATGDADDAIELADLVVVVIDGQVLQIDTPTELLARPFDDRVAALLGSNRGIRRLQFASIDLLEPDDRPIIHTSATSAAARFVARPTSPWVLVVDDDRRPVGWLNTEGLSENGHATDEPLVALDSESIVRDGDSLSIVFDRMLSSPSRLVAKLNADGRAVGVFAHADIADMAAEAMN